MNLTSDCLKLPRERFSPLGDNGFVHDDDPVGDRQRLFLVVGHVDRGQAQVLLQFELR